MSQMTLSAQVPAADPPAASLLEVRGLTVGFPTHRGAIYPARRVSFSVEKGQTLGLVGESGSGKSVTLRAILGLVPSPGRIVEGQVVFDGRDLVGAGSKVLQSIRGTDVGMIFQDPMASLNPVLSVGDQLTETLRLKVGLGRRAAAERAEELLHHVGIRPAKSRLRSYPHQLSGGQAQRVMIALAVAGNPRLLLADEPTTALDVSVQDQVLSLLEELRRETGMSMIIVSHDIGVIARSCDKVAVMYAGSLLERGAVEEVLRRPRHPYTRMLLATVPSLRPNIERKALVSIGGQLPDLATLARGCPFAARCDLVRNDCASVPVSLDAPMDAHGSACPFG
jgi:oligopeptide/dipeptide ABC transporter ATP-binding protein